MVLLSLLLVFSASSAITINEIMYNPDDIADVSSNEWVELYNPINQTVDMSYWKFTGNGVEVLPENTTIAPLSYLILAKNKTLFTKHFNVNYSIVADVPFNSLSDKGKNIFLNDSNGIYVDDINYSPSWGADGDGKSLQRTDLNTWCNATPTPGAANNCSSVTSITNITTNTTAGDCDLSLDVNASKTIYYNSESIDYDLIVSDILCAGVAHDYALNYRIEDLFGGFLKNPDNSTYHGTACKHSVPHTKKADEICGTEAYLIKAEIMDAGCNDTNSANNYDEFLIVVKGKDPQSSICRSSTSSTAAKTASSASTAKNFEVKILEVPAEATSGQSFTATAVLTNFYDSQKTFDVYSYVYRGNVPLTEGGWTGNRQNITVGGLKSETIELSNILKLNITLGEYDFRIRAALGDEKSDANSVISILAGNSSEPVKQKSAQTKQAKQAANKTANKTVEKTGNITQSFQITGAVTWTSEKMQNSSVAMLLFIFVLLILVVALLVSRR